MRTRIWKDTDPTNAYPWFYSVGTGDVGTTDYGMAESFDRALAFALEGLSTSNNRRHWTE